MSSSTKTSNYELSQFAGSDKPAWLSDYNTDMSKIDTQMKANADAATAASGSASTANTAIGTLANLTTEAKTSAVAAINEVDAHADTAQNTANEAASTATGADTKASNALTAIGKFNFTDFGTTTVTISGGTMVVGNNTLSYATNSDGSIGKIYGRVVYDVTNATYTLSMSSPFRPTSAINVDGIFLALQDGGTLQVMLPMTIGTDGTITISATSTTNVRYRLFGFAAIIFMKDFGD